MSDEGRKMLDEGRNKSEFVEKCWNLSKNVGICRKMSEFVGICRIMSDFVGICRIMSDNEINIEELRNVLFRIVLFHLFYFIYRRI